jgi:glycosyltransferase involved in cell wall biosynthesis
VVSRCAGWLAWGHTVEQCVLARPGYPAKPHRVVPMGVDVEDFRPDPSRGSAFLDRFGWTRAGPPVVGYLGRFVEEKGLAVLMAALEECRAPWRALFVGAGPMKERLKSWAQGQSGRVVVHGAVPHDEVPAVLNAFDVLCAPSQTTPSWKEQFGRMISEAFACGVPVLASDSGEIPFTVGDAGVVLPERDFSAWSKALEALLDSPERRRLLGAQGRERAVAKFAWPVVARAHLELFEGLR